jgi:hypothetical protein
MSTLVQVYLFTAYASLTLTGVINNTGAAFSDRNEQQYRY